MDNTITKEKLEKTGKVEFHTNVAVKEIKGDKFVESLIYENRDTGKDKGNATQSASGYDN